MGITNRLFSLIRYRGNVSTEPLGRNDIGIFTEPLPSIDRGDTQTHRQQRDLISLFLFFQNKESRLKKRANAALAGIKPEDVRTRVLQNVSKYPPD
jgi:hypothetical protein